MIGDRTSKLHFSSIVVDTHSDSLGRVVKSGEDLGQETGTGHMDLPRMRAGNVTAQFFAAYIDPKYLDDGTAVKRVLRYVDALKVLCEKYQSEIELARTAKDVRRIVASGKLAGILCLEGGHAIEDDLAVLRQFHELGIRYMTLTHNNTNNWADGVLGEPRHDGLTDFGRDVVKEMDRIGMMVDISHVSVKTFWDVIETTSKPVIASHSSAWKICQNPRNMRDDQIRAVGENGGVVCVNYEVTFVSNAYNQATADMGEKISSELYEVPISSKSHDDTIAELKNSKALKFEESPESAQEIEEMYEGLIAAEHKRPYYTEIVDHIDHMVALAGIDHVGLGSDFDGARMPVGMDDCSKVPLITDELVRRGYSDNDIKKVLGENVLRLMQDVLGN
ncbi:MAG: dipeptidase [SAR202 cluster bacterium]|jgi:membrane dipeptidase|nr:dipeptidase [SAR202 cluster bacterium]